MSDKKPLSLYVHFPYCQRKCRYCDFVSFENKYGTQEKYTIQLKNELSQYDFSSYEIKTVFVGGGTPSSLKAEYIESILSGIKEKCTVSPDAEITVECNPNSLTREKLLTYRRSGVNRISIGIQSFDNNVLETLGRLHNAESAEESIKLAFECGFENVSCDLMFSIPGQTVKSVLDSVEKAVSLGVTHISLYSLIVEENTEMESLIGSGELIPVDDETDRKMYSEAVKLLGENGFEQYEISNFAKAGKASRHNTVYWERGEYVGLGVAAHSFFNGIRYSNTSSLEEYLSSVNVAENMSSGEKIEWLSAAEETVMLGLRMNNGFDKTLFDIEKHCKKSISLLEKEGLIKVAGNNISATEKGRDVLNKITLEIVSEL